MTIKCKICNKLFEKQITNSHLKIHNLTTIEYKEKYGELSSDEYKKALSLSRSGSNNNNFGKKWDDHKKKMLSEKKKNSIPWNKGKSINVTEKMKLGIQSREEKYKNNVLTRKRGYSLSNEHKQHIRQKISDYAKLNPDEISDRAKKAVVTKIKNNYDFGKNMRGKTHSIETKQLISEKSTINNQCKIKISKEKKLKFINQANLSLLAEENKILHLKCNFCNTCFSLTPQCVTDSKYRVDWCQTCYPLQTYTRSNYEIELHDFVKTLSKKVTFSNHQTSSKKEIAIKFPIKKIAIEFISMYWHSEAVLEYQGKSKYSDFQKMKSLKNTDIRYIGIFEDEWLYKKEIVKSRLKNILNTCDNIIYGRKCIVQKISSSLASEFCKNNHLQGSGKSNVKYGLFYNDELVSVMTFSKTNISKKINTWQVNRFCSKLNYTIVGGASKLFKQFIKQYDPIEVISYADNRWSEGNLYKILNFTLVSQIKPIYWYFLPNDLHRLHRYTLCKTKNDIPGYTEKEIRALEGYLRIWDCGSTKWIWKKGQ